MLSENSKIGIMARLSFFLPTMTAIPIASASRPKHRLAQPVKPVRELRPAASLAGEPCDEQCEGLGPDSSLPENRHHGTPIRKG